MKKAGIIIFILVVLAIVSTYIFIPGKIIAHATVHINCTPATSIRSLHNYSKWHQWFPGKTNNDSVLDFKGRQYVLGAKKYISTDVLIIDDKEKYASSIDIIPLKNDVSIVQWQFQFVASNNPLKRIQQYQSAKSIKNNNSIVLESFKTFSENTKNVYDFYIKYTTLTDTALVSIKKYTKQYPSTSLIYSMIDELKAYIKSQHASEHNYPMLNVRKVEDDSYEVMTGVPTNIPLKGTGIILPKRMIMLKNKTLVTEVVGDTSVVNKTLQATTNFMYDHQLASPVISFQQLVTDRTKEKDSTKWITRIFSPII